MSNLSDAQHLLLLEAVETGKVVEHHHTQRQCFRRLVELGMLKYEADPKSPDPDNVCIFPFYYPTTRGRAWVWWYLARRQPIKPFRCPPGGTIERYRR